MRVSREQAELNRIDVVKAASRGFRERGFDGIGIAEIMKAAGLTHGGFYGQFTSKEHLAREAVGEALEGARQRWRSVLSTAEDAPMAALADFYLSTAHRDQIAEGCALAALASDAARSGPEVRATFSEGIEKFLDILQEIGESRDRALADLALLVGAMVLARSADNSTLSEDFLASARKRLKEPPPG